jgi:PiT family inorganic phosphate transporter
MISIAILLAVLCLAYANGANDNFKGVATLLGSGTTNYRQALAWATITTLLGSLTAVFLAEKLLTSFSGRGLVADQLVTSPDYVAAIALGAACTVLLATRIGMPVSTTHALVGAMIGAGWAAHSDINLQKLGAGFFLPLLVSPLVAVAITSLCYLALHRLRLGLGITHQTCFCIGKEAIEVVPIMSTAAALQRVEHLTLSKGTAVTCIDRYDGRLLGVNLASLIDRLHYLSAGVVSFARGLNDTPKIAALLLLLPALGGFGSTFSVGVAMAVGGWLGAARVAEVMARKITPMNHGQGFVANLLTGSIVIGASHFGLPVSTTQVSCGALFGIGTVTGQADVRTIAKILIAWVTTLPAAVLLGASAFWITSHA